MPFGLSFKKMNCPRRTFLVLAAALASSWSMAATHRLRAEPVLTQFLLGELSEYGPTPSLAFNGGTPGPLLKVRQDEKLSVRFENRTGEAPSVRWHRSIRIANGKDGVPGLTQNTVSDGQSSNTGS